MQQKHRPPVATPIPVVKGEAAQVDVVVVGGGHGGGHRQISWRHFSNNLGNGLPRFDNLFAICEYVAMRRQMQVEWSVRSIKDMRRLSPGDRELVIAKIEQYAEFPEALANQVSSLTNSDYLRLRVGNYRVIFSVDNSTVAIMLVLRVRHRREAYD